MTGYSGVVSVEAMRFAHDNGIAIVLLDWSRDFLSIVAPPAIQSANLIRAQASANPLPIAKEIVCQKLTAYVRVGGLTREDAARRIEAVAQARSIQAVMTQEAQGARFAWQHSIPSIIWRSSPVSVPRAWKLPYSTRGRDGSPRDAVQPVNALLNVAFSVTAGRLVALLAARGGAPSIGFLHSDKENRWSLAYDAIEPLRPLIERSVFDLIRARKFAPNDFILTQDGTIRLMDNLLRVVIAETAIKDQMLNGVVEWIVGLIQGGIPVAGSTRLFHSKSLLFQAAQPLYHSGINLD